MHSHEAIIRKTTCFVKEQLRNAEAGHDWWHVQRVWNTSKLMAKTETCDLLVVELGALLHDIADSKFHDGDEEKGPKIAGKWLNNLGIPKETARAVDFIIRNISFKNSFKNSTSEMTIELEIVMDADRLDAIGAIGIARAFHYGGHKNRLLYHPQIPPANYASPEDYRNSEAPTINHFYEKLLKLKDGMHTATGKSIAEQRHAFMEQYLTQFYAEWHGEGASK